MTTAGIRVLEDRPGGGARIQRQRSYRLRLKLWLNRGEAIRWDQSSVLMERARVEDDGASLVADLRIDRENLIAGLFQGIDGMRVGGLRKLRISPHLAYGDQGIPGKIPPGAVIIAEIEFIAARDMGNPDE